MFRMSIEALSPYQSLLGIRYHRGIEVMEDDRRVPIIEIQVGLALIHITFTWYQEESDETES